MATQVKYTQQLYINGTIKDINVVKGDFNLIVPAMNAYKSSVKKSGLEFLFKVEEEGQPIRYEYNIKPENYTEIAKLLPEYL